ncbi:hypothetical protein PLEOSDRAFT_1049356 [Pleurotus ostreatus PC15]|uniref:RING-type domain-containing protein n=1 Tax=Pleurotus ostreatus (strain PC15) TaxID=1137138 RepID=A0A067N8X1_PLEO1|nr:hypothetical protein PLEOSDRAFT_1049356 [Pleurotus ostreatus PC15]
MLSLNPGSACDVCAEEYGPHRSPHSIPCGHVLCASCCSTIVDKTAPRLAPVCPFCREHFSSDSVRLIRLDFSSSGWSTPRRKGGTIEANLFAGVVGNGADPTGELLARHSERMKLPEGGSKARIEARRLEDKVAKVAAKKCSVEEVTTLHKELQEWLSSDAKPDDQTSSLFLSAALLRAILMNHVAHSEASKIARHMEADLKGKLDGLISQNHKLESDLRRERQTLSQKITECNSLRTELSRLKALASTIGVPTGSSSPEPPYPQSPSPTPPVTPSTTPSAPSYNSLSPMTHAPTPLSRFNSIHTRSVSVSSRPSTPTTSPSSSTPAPPTSLVSPYRSHTPGPPSRSHSQTPALRSQTPSVRSYTPSIRSSTPGVVSPSHQQYRSQTPAPPLPHHSPLNNGIQPSRPRRLSVNLPSPQKIMRSVSEEKQELHERWIPHVEPDSPVPTSKTPAPYATTPARSRTLSTAAIRYKATSPNDN